jgi:hypothetical protein
VAGITNASLGILVNDTCSRQTSIALLRVSQTLLRIIHINMALETAQCNIATQRDANAQLFGGGGVAKMDTDSARDGQLPNKKMLAIVGPTGSIGAEKDLPLKEDADDCQPTVKRRCVIAQATTCSTADCEVKSKKAP